MAYSVTNINGCTKKITFTLAIVHALWSFFKTYFIDLTNPQKGMFQKLQEFYQNKNSNYLLIGLFPITSIFLFQFISGPSPDIPVYVLSFIIFFYFLENFKIICFGYEKFENDEIKKYLEILNKSPHIIQSIPLTIIASYLGISLETLSRIRAKI